MNQVANTIESKILPVIFFIFLLAAIVLISKASLITLKINSSGVYSATYFSLFDAGVIFTKHIYYSMFRVYQYATLLITAAICGVCILWLQYLQ